MRGGRRLCRLWIRVGGGASRQVVGNGRQMETRTKGEQAGKADTRGKGSSHRHLEIYT